MQTHWSKHPIQQGNVVSVVFSWQLWALIEQGEPQEGPLVVGGPAVAANPQWLPSWMSQGVPREFLSQHNPQAMRTSLGCIRSCPFCIVPKIEGALRELPIGEPKPVVIDNNLLACSRKHFDRVIDALKPLDWCDFNQGLDARLLTAHHASRFAELRNPTIRLALDSIFEIAAFRRAFDLLSAAGIPARHVQVYVLIGFEDYPSDARYRLELVRRLGALPNPMRYQPINAKKKNAYVGAHWMGSELTRYMRYWARLRYTNSIPFDEFDTALCGRKRRG